MSGRLSHCFPTEQLQSILLDKPATRAGGMADGPAGAAAAGPDGGVADAPDGGVADAPDGGAAYVPDGGAPDARTTARPPRGTAGEPPRGTGAASRAAGHRRWLTRGPRALRSRLAAEPNLVPSSGRQMALRPRVAWRPH